ncbi:Beige protein [Wickerhamomyces ciferrii]|uniref:Beige protein n=1 Tax=Wickerhamomyces ciferrii (strain ATCC 14091 / BCRC 22168 / CBS 111 / JCM 3599 / NBRC 0793 / NRRL Y-1031 F-60-10) TaxID=1206466 RepID=K0KHH0_WICCF|nr:Beige protein [Wickerhamomyces ciferrii]CCH42461.1 Beige protein [Wickerhamomyces ciferrii]
MDQLKNLTRYKTELNFSNYEQTYQNIQKDIHDLTADNKNEEIDGNRLIYELIFSSISIDGFSGEVLVEKAESIIMKSIDDDLSIVQEVPGLIDQFLDNFSEISQGSANIIDEKLLGVAFGILFLDTDSLLEKKMVIKSFLIELAFRLCSKSERNRSIISQIPGITHSIIGNLSDTSLKQPLQELFLELSKSLLLPYDLLSLINKSIESSSTEQQFYLDQITSLLNTKNTNHLHFKNSSVKVPVSYVSSPSNGYTNQFWIKFNNLEKSDFFRDISGTILRLDDGNLCLIHKNRLLVKFESFQFEEGRYYHIVLLHQLAKLSNGNAIKGKVKLFINGEFIEQERLIYSTKDFNFHDNPGAEVSSFITIGSNTCDFEIAKLLIVNEVQAIEWILLSYYLGIEYQGDFSDDTLIKFLSIYERTRFNLKLLESKNNIDGDLSLEDLNLKIIRSNLLLNITAGNSLSEELFERGNDYLTANSSSLLTISGSIYHYQATNISEVFYSIGSLQLFLKLLFAINDMDVLYNTLSIFFKLVNSNWKFAMEVETISGYQLIATILKLKRNEFKQSLDLRFLDLILDFCGYNFASPYHSAIINPLAYEALILDFHIWKPFNEEFKQSDLELSKNLIFQFQVFAKDCKYSSFNSLKLKKMKVVKKLLTFLTQSFFSPEMEDNVFDTLLIMVKTSLFPDTVKSLSSFVVHALNEGNESAAVLVLRVLAAVFLDPLISNVSYWRKLFGAPSLKWILLVLQLGKKNKEVVDIALSLSMKIFLMVRKSFDLFYKNNGLKILFSSLRDVKLDKRELNILVKGSFGHYQYDLNFQKLDSELSEHLAQYDKLIIPELHYMILDLLEWTILHDIFQTSTQQEISGLIDSYTALISKISEESKGIEKFFQNDKQFINKLCNIIILVTKPQNTTIYFDSAEKIIQFLSSVILSKIFKGDASGLEAYINSFLQKNDDETSDSTRTLFLSFVFPKVLKHLQDFSSEFKILFSTDALEIESIAVFLNLLNDRLLDFEWNKKDYFSFFNVSLAIVEAYKGSGKNTKRSSYLQLKKNIANVCTVIMYVLRFSTSMDQLENFLKILLFHQENLFENGSLSNECISNLICFLLEVSMKSEPMLTGLSLNCLRILLMHRQGDLTAICASITFKNFTTAAKYLDSILSMNDDDLVSKLVSDSRLKSTFCGHLDSFENKISKKISKQQFITGEEKMNHLFEKHDQFIKFKYETIEKLGKLLQDDNEMLRIKVVTSEANKLARNQQDQQDNIQFYISSFNKINVEITKFMNLCFNNSSINSRWTLDYMEGSDRMRKRLLPYDDLTEDQKVAYSIEVPVKPIAANIANEQPKNESLSLNSFELIEHDLTDDSIGTYNDKNRKVLKSLFPGDRIHQLWNVSQVVGLEINEGILILGETHLYLIRNFFHKSENDEIIDMDDVPEGERDPNVKLISGQPRPKSATGKRELKDHNVQTWELHKLTSVTKRQFLLRDVALEIFFSNGGSFLITSINTRDRDIIYSSLSSVATNSNIDSDLSAIFKETNLNNTSGITGRNISMKLANVFGTDYINYLEATKKWQRGEMSNFYYLMIVNTLAGRTFNDLTQYPVFPWVIADYTSDELDLTNPESFRDLSKPMGAQTPQRAAQFKERYEALLSFDNEDAPAFHYGTHYSSAMIVASFLIRLEPFIQSYLLLQGGKIDHADRLFNSIEKAWKSASKDNTTDVRELIPEFFFLPEFLSNINGYDFGRLQDGTEVNHVQLPKWAKGDPKIFVEKNREALESKFVSDHLHEWIDLIFGFKQIGPEAVEALNVFNYLSYQGAIDLDKIDNVVERRSITGIIHNFGQTPQQVFNKPHPPREYNSILSVRYDKLKTNPTLIYQTKVHEPIHYLQYKTHSDNSGDAFWRGYPKLVLNGEIEVKLGNSEGSLVINRRTFERVHDDKIIALKILTGSNNLITGTKNGIIHVWNYNVIIKGLNEQLEFEAPLRGHLSPIKELQVSPEYSLLLSLDSLGNCYLWDLVRYKFIQKIDIMGDHCAISYDTGMIAVSNESEVTLFTINGEKIINDKFGIDDDVYITCLDFANFRKLTLNKSQNVDSHEFWYEKEILLTGWSNGDIKIHVLDIDPIGNWTLVEKASLNFSESSSKTNGKFSNKSISIVEGYLKSYINFEGESIGKIEVVAGDVNGRVAVWR